MTFLEQELSKLFAKNPLPLADIRFIGDACYGRLNEDVQVKIAFVTCGCMGKYEALQVTLLNRKEGPIDHIQLRFSELWGKKAVQNPNFSEGLEPYIWQDGSDISWYVYQPTKNDYKQLFEAVNSYLAIFQEPLQEQRIGQCLG